MSLSSVFRKPVVIVACVAVVVAVGAAFVSGNSSSAALHLTGQFADASPLLPGNEVMLNGVKVGSVDSIRLDGRIADVAISVDKAALPIHNDARLTIKPVTLLGERYVDLNQGSASAPLIANNGVIPQSHTGADVSISDVLNTLDQPTSADLAGMIGTLGNGLDHNGSNTAAAVKLLTPVMNNASAFASVLKQQNQTLSSLVDSLSKVASGVAADQGKAMNGLVAAADTVTATTAQNEAAFRSTLQELPGTLSAANTTLGQLAATANGVTPTLSALRPTLDQLPAISGELSNFSTAANPALEAANPVLAKATDLLARLRPVVSVLQQNINSVTDDSKALGNLTATLGPNFSSVVGFVRNWALATNGSDGLSHYFRGLVVLTPNILTGALPLGTSSSTSKTSTGGGLGGVLNNLLGSKGLLNLPQSLLSPKTSSNGGVTGLTLSQELGAATSLLGGN